MFSEPNKFTFLDVTSNQVWVGDLWRVNENITYDGETFQMEKGIIYLGTYFFLSDERVEHIRDAYTVIALLA